MSTLSDAVLSQLKTSSRDQALKAAVVGKKALLDGLRDVISTEDLVRVEGYFDRALSAKVAAYVAATPEEAIEAEQIFEAELDAIETLILRYEIVGRATIARLARSMAHAVISGLFAVGGAVLQAGLTVLFPGGGLVGAFANTGLNFVVNKILGD